MSALRMRDRRALRVGAAIIAPVLIWRALLAPLSARIADARDRGDTEAQLFARELAVARDGGGLSAQLAQAHRSLEAATTTLMRASDSTAASRSLLLRVQSLADAAHLQSFRSDAAPMAPAAGIVVGAQADVRAQGDARAVAAWLSAVERPDHGLAVMRVRIERTDAGALTLTARVRALVLRSAP